MDQLEKIKEGLKQGIKERQDCILMLSQESNDIEKKIKNHEVFISEANQALSLLDRATNKDEEAITSLTNEVMIAFDKFEQITGKSVDGFDWQHAESGKPYFKKRPVFKFKELTYPFDPNAKVPDTKPHYGGALV